MSKYSLRVELDSLQERKLKANAAAANSPLTEFIKKYIDALPSPISKDLDKFNQDNPMLIRKLEYWAGKRKAPEGQVTDYLLDLVFATTSDLAKKSSYKWRDLLSGQEKAALLKYLPRVYFSSEMMQAVLGATVIGNWYNTETGDYTTVAEPIIKDFNNAVVTLNAYSAFILNANRMLIVDVDTSTDDQINVLNPVVTDNRNLALGVLDAFIKENPDMGFRVYDTACGLRYICTTHEFDPASKASEMVMKSLLCDPRYAALCRKQGTYRARLTPKPWRISMFDVPDKLTEHDWHEKYRVCTYIKTVGNQYIQPEFTDLINQHDCTTAALNSDNTLEYA